jgi:Site-specific DNA methylase
VNVLDLFSGIGGFSLGLERAGMRTVAFCEIDHWRTDLCEEAADLIERISRTNQDKTLPRYGIQWNGPQEPIATPMPDGYWTPWHLAMGLPSMETTDKINTPK